VDGNLPVSAVGQTMLNDQTGYFDLNLTLLYVPEYYKLWTT